MSLWGEWRCAVVGSGEQSVVNLHPGDHLVPWQCAGNCLVPVQVSFSLLQSRCKDDIKCVCYLSTNIITMGSMVKGMDQYSAKDNVSATSSQIAFRAFNSFYGEGDGPVFSVACTTFYNRLDECTISNQTMCSHSQDGGAICAGMLVGQQLQSYISCITDIKQLKMVSEQKNFKSVTI